MTIKKVYYNWQDIQGACLDIARQINNDNYWYPDYVVGISRGGLIPAVLLSQYLNIPMKPLMVSLRDSGECVSDLGMAEDAFGYISIDDRTYDDMPFDNNYAKNILIVDDINDTGATIDWIKKDWVSGCLPNNERWNYVWGKNVRFAALTNNLSSKETVDYNFWEVNKGEEDCWLVYPWEEFWINKK